MKHTYNKYLFKIVHDQYSLCNLFFTFCILYKNVQKHDEVTETRVFFFLPHYESSIHFTRAKWLVFLANTLLPIGGITEMCAPHTHATHAQPRPAELRRSHSSRRTESRLVAGVGHRRGPVVFVRPVGAVQGSQGGVREGEGVLAMVAVVLALGQRVLSQGGRAR